MSFYEAIPAEKTVHVRLVIEPVDTDGTSSGNHVRPLEFELGFFDFPMIDNTRLSENHRIALTMRSYNSDAIDITGILFPGRLASHRDKPFLNDAISELRRR